MRREKVEYGEMKDEDEDGVENVDIDIQEDPDTLRTRSPPASRIFGPQQAREVEVHSYSGGSKYLPSYLPHTVDSVIPSSYV